MFKVVNGSVEVIESRWGNGKKTSLQLMFATISAQIEKGHCQRLLRILNIAGLSCPFPLPPPYFRQIGRLAVVHLYHFWLDHWSIAFLLITYFCLVYLLKSSFLCSNQFWIISSHRHCQVRVRPTKDPSLWQPIPTIATKWIQVCLRIIMTCHCFWDLLGYFRMGDTGLPERRKD